MRETARLAAVVAVEAEEKSVAVVPLLTYSWMSVVVPEAAACRRRPGRARGVAVGRRGDRLIADKHGRRAGRTVDIGGHRADFD